MRQFLGLTSYYRRFVELFATIANPLHTLTKKDARFHWTQECQLVFDTLRQKLVESPVLVLAYPSFDEDFTLETDAIIFGLGAVLSQVQEDGLPHPVAFASRATSPPEKNYIWHTCPGNPSSCLVTHPFQTLPLWATCRNLY